jgi:hypothetical protein
MLIAVETYGNAIRYASTDLRDDHEIVLRAITHSPHTVKYASKILLNERDIFMVAVTKNTYALQYFRKTRFGKVLKEGHNIVFKHLVDEDKSFDSIIPILSNDNDFVLTTIQYNSYMSNDVRENPECVAYMLIHHAAKIFKNSYRTTSKERHDKIHQKNCF